MVVIPAIDLRGGRCVRLRQGDYRNETVFSDEPAAVARRWVESGATHLHVVDLDGAREGRPVNIAVIEQIARTSGVKCQLGGGLRADEDVDRALACGIDRVVVGTRALQDVDWLRRLCERHASRVAVGVDAREGRVAVDGWTKDMDRSAMDVMRQCAEFAIGAIVYTDISRDGMMNGPNFDAYADLVATIGVPVVASGGVTTLDDVRRLAEIGVAGCIIGRALYEGRIELTDAIRIASSNRSAADG